MRPGQLRRLSYREVLDAYRLILCEDPATCKRRLSVNAHQVGTVDAVSNIHWSRVDTRVTRRGLRRLLVLIGGIFLKHKSRRPPLWQRLYEANVWAWREGISRWHVQFTQEMSKADRIRAYRQGSAEARATNFAAYQWMRGRNKKWAETMPSTTKIS